MLEATIKSLYNLWTKTCQDNFEDVYLDNFLTLQLEFVDLCKDVTLPGASLLQQLIILLRFYNNNSPETNTNDDELTCRFHHVEKCKFCFQYALALQPALVSGQLCSVRLPAVTLRTLFKQQIKYHKSQNLFISHKEMIRMVKLAKFCVIECCLQSDEVVNDYLQELEQVVEDKEYVRKEWKDFEINFKELELSELREIEAEIMAESDVIVENPSIQSWTCEDETIVTEVVKHCMVTRKILSQTFCTAFGPAKTFSEAMKLVSKNNPLAVVETSQRLDTSPTSQQQFQFYTQIAFDHQPQERDRKGEMTFLEESPRLLMNDENSQHLRNLQSSPNYLKHSSPRTFDIDTQGNVFPQTNTKSDERVEEVVEATVDLQAQRRASQTTRAVRRPWSKNEVQALEEGLGLYGKQWTLILDKYKNVFASTRTNVDLKDKARNEKRRLQRLNQPLGVWEIV